MIDGVYFSSAFIWLKLKKLLPKERACTRLSGSLMDWVVPRAGSPNNLEVKRLAGLLFGKYSNPYITTNHGDGIFSPDDIEHTDLREWLELPPIEVLKVCERTR